MALTSPRGRSGGRPSSWRSPTKMMRLPARYERQIVEFAHRLDSESEEAGGELRRAIDTVLLSLRPGDRREAKALFKKLLVRLEEGS